MEGEDEIEDRLQYQLSSLSLSPEKHELLPYFQCRDTTPSLPQEFYSSGGETAFLGQGPPTSHNLHHGAAAVSAHNGQQLITLEENANMRGTWEEMKVLKDENMELREAVQSLQAKLEQMEEKLKQSENQCYALGVHLAMAMPPNG